MDYTKLIKKFYDFFEDNKDKRILVNYGGAGSAKSVSTAQFFIRRFFEGQNERFLVVRKTLPSLKITAYQLVLDLLEAYNLPYHLNKTEMTISYKTNKLLFKSLDDPEKIKSYEASKIWVEEANEISLNDFRQLNLRLRRKGSSPNQIVLTFNPVSKFHWLYTTLVEKPKDNIAVLQSTYKDNPFLDEVYVDELKSLKGEDATYYQIYALGEWGVLQNTIYTNYNVIKDKDWPDSFEQTILGLDFGYNNETGLLEIGIKDAEYYERELIYETHLTNQDLIEKLKILISEKDRDRNIYADSAEPARIEEIQRAGFNVYESDKDVKMGIDFVKRHKVHIHEDSVNHINEKRAYKYKEDKDGNVLEEPVKFRDHLQDCERYALYTHSNEVEPSFFTVSMGARS